MNSQFGLVKVDRALLTNVEGESGSVLSVSPTLRIAFVGGSLDLIEVRPEGKKRMSGRDFANGARIRPGMRFV